MTMWTGLQKASPICRYAEDAGRDPAQIEIALNGLVPDDETFENEDGERMLTGSDGAIIDDIGATATRGSTNLLLTIWSLDRSMPLQRIMPKI